MAAQSPSMVRSAALRRSAFSLAKAFSIGLKWSSSAAAGAAGHLNPWCSDPTRHVTAEVSAAIAHLQQLGIVREMTGKQRGRVYLYDEYMKILNVGTEPYRRGGTPRERTHLA